MSENEIHPAAAATPAKARKPRAYSKKKPVAMTKAQGAALFAGAVALGQVITLAIAKWMGVAINAPF